jgi:phage shock protein A
MALINRVSRLFRADLHAVLDRIEEPEVLLRQAIREMEEGVARDEQRVRLLAHEQSQLGTRQNDLERTLERSEEELDVCFRSGNEGLARGVMRRRLEAQRALESLAGRRAVVASTLGELQARGDTNHRRLEAMRQKADALAREDVPPAADHGWAAPDTLVRDEDVELALLRERQRRGVS